MKVIFVPSRLRLATGAMALCIVLAAIEVVVVKHAPWWRLPYKSLGFWCLVTTLIVSALSVWLWRGSQWALRSTKAFAIVWSVLGVLVAIRQQNPGLGFLALLVAMYWVALYSWLRLEFGRSFFDPHMGWYQGEPQPIPGLRCQVPGADLRVCRLDLNGAFVFGGAGVFNSINDILGSQKGRLVEMTFSYKDREICCKGLPIRFLQDHSGMGLQFQEMSDDLRKNLGDFVELLQGEGHG
jgi:hypothetical protein